MREKLTKVQNKVINCLQNGYVIITDNSMTGAIIGNNQDEFHIDNGVFYRLMDKNLIYQQLAYPFNFELTKKGKEISTTN